MDIPTLPGVTAKMIESARLRTRVLFYGPEDGIPVLFVHGNASNATYWEETMAALPAGYRGIAADNRGYSGADPAKKIDATRGLKDFSDDLAALMDTLGIQKAHIVGHSLGGSIVWQMMMDYAPRLLSVTQAAPGSPYGFGGIKLDGTPCYPDFSGSGGGIVSADFVAAIVAGDRSAEPNSPRFIMNTFYWKPPFKAQREEELLSGLLAIHTGDQDYRGDFVPSANYPFVGPGVWGPNNALSAKYADDVSKLYGIDPKPRVLWVRGADDQIVSDNSLFETGLLGKLGLIPAYPGEEAFPPQPMVSQTRAVLEQYKAHGGAYEEVVFPETGHTPYLERFEEFNRHLHAHLAK
jgi:pimeloyl-ACP methyl ester carboxylesterase